VSNAEANYRPESAHFAVEPFTFGQVGASTHVVRGLMRGLLGRFGGGQRLWRAVAEVGLVLEQQLLSGRRVAIEPLHLAVRTVRAARRATGHLRTLIPVEAKPLQVVQDVALVFDGVARLIGVFEAQ